MYSPPQFEETRIDYLHALMRSYALATLIIDTEIGISANPVPLLLVPETSQYGVLRGHIARANPLWQGLRPDREALAIFQGPNCYISPSWYPSKALHGKVVPTWNYAVVHAYGPLRVIDDSTWIRRQLDDLTAQQEAGFAKPWALADAPSEFTEKLIEAIVGIELNITRLIGKCKLSQNQPEENKTGVINGLKMRGIPAASDMAKLMEDFFRNHYQELL